MQENDAKIQDHFTYLQNTEFCAESGSEPSGIMDPDPEHSDYVYATQLVLNSIITSVSDP
jgi:hypothetical protein